MKINVDAIVFSRISIGIESPINHIQTTVGGVWGN